MNKKLRRPTMLEQVEQLTTSPRRSREQTMVEAVEGAEQQRSENAVKTAEPNVDNSRSAEAVMGHPRPSNEKSPDCEVFRPIGRPPMGLLFILDDGSRTNGECIRVRAERTVIGRSARDVAIPHDNSISSEHVEIVLEQDQERSRWFLQDLESTNGTFVRASKFFLKHNQQVLIGCRRYSFKRAFQADAADWNSTKKETDYKATMEWKTVSEDDVRNRYPTLVEQLPSGEEGVTIVISSDEATLGADASACTYGIKNDPFVSKVHARLSKSKSGHWIIQDMGSVNGTWLRVERLPMEMKCEFQIGEQRFVFQPI